MIYLNRRRKRSAASIIFSHLYIIIVCLQYILSWYFMSLWWAFIYLKSSWRYVILALCEMKVKYTLGYAKIYLKYIAITYKYKHISTPLSIIYSYQAHGWVHVNSCFGHAALLVVKRHCVTRCKSILMSWLIWWPRAACHSFHHREHVWRFSKISMNFDSMLIKRKCGGKHQINCAFSTLFTTHLLMPNKNCSRSEYIHYFFVRLLLFYVYSISKIESSNNKKINKWYWRRLLAGVA